MSKEKQVSRNKALEIAKFYAKLKVDEIFDTIPYAFTYGLEKDFTEKEIQHFIEILKSLMDLK